MINFCEVGRKISLIFQPEQTITYFDVKELYNLAYEQKSQARDALRQFRAMEAEAKAMDVAYRAQLGLIRRAA